MTRFKGWRRAVLYYKLQEVRDWIVIAGIIPTDGEYLVMLLGTPKGGNPIETHVHKVVGSFGSEAEASRAAEEALNEFEPMSEQLCSCKEV